MIFVVVKNLPERTLVEVVVEVDNILQLCSVQIRLYKYGTGHKKW